MNIGSFRFFKQALMLSFIFVPRAFGYVTHKVIGGMLPKPGGGCGGFQSCPGGGRVGSHAGLAYASRVGVGWLRR